jgi:hypothetical protein
MKFSTFADAKEFATKLAIDLGKSVLLTRSSDGWIVHNNEESENAPLVSPDPHAPTSLVDDAFFSADPAIENWRLQKAQHTTCYMCNGTGHGSSGGGRMCHTCMGLGYIND